MKTMKAVVFKGKDQIAVEEVPRPAPRAGEAVIRITTTTICGTDVHIVRGEYPVKPGLVLGHEPVGVIEELGAGLEETYSVGQRVIVGAITPCGQCFYCLNGTHSQCGRAGGWRFGNTINGAWAEYLLCPTPREPRADSARAVRRRRPAVSRHFFDRSQRGGKRPDQGWRFGRRLRPGPDRPVCDARRQAQRGVLIIGIDAVNRRLEVARRFGANVTLNTQDGDPVPEIKRLTEGRGVDVAIEALGRQETFENALRAIRPGGTLSSLGVYSGKLTAPYEAFYAGLGDQKIVTTLCPGGKERMRRPWR